MNDLQGMIQNGAFGFTQPFNPYTMPQQPQPIMFNNMIPVGSYGYNTYPMQQQNQYVFQPVGGGYNPQPYYQPQQNYYNPFPQFQQQQQYWGNPYNGYYNYGNYRNFSPFMSMQYQQEMMNAEIQKRKFKYKIMAKVNGIEYTEEELDIKFNPNNPANIKKVEERRDVDREWNEIIRVMNAFPTAPDHSPHVQAKINFLNNYYHNCNAEFGNHSMFEFFNNDLPKLQREEWICENIRPKQNRNLGATYNSAAYNELLNLHKSSNPYINEILNQSKYDNNVDDQELGLAEIFDSLRQRRNLLSNRQPLPSFVSSPEVQEARAKYTQELMDALFKKEQKVNNV